MDLQLISMAKQSSLSWYWQQYVWQVLSDDLLLVIRKKENLIDKTMTNSQDTLVCKRNTSRQIFSLDTPLIVADEKWLLGLTTSEVYYSVYNTTKAKDVFLSQLNVSGLILKQWKENKKQMGTFRK